MAEQWRLMVSATLRSVCSADEFFRADKRLSALNIINSMFYKIK